MLKHNDSKEILCLCYTDNTSKKNRFCPEALKSLNCEEHTVCMCLYRFVHKTYIIEEILYHFRFD